MRIGVLNNLRSGRSTARVRRLLGLLDRYPEVAHVETTSVAAVPEALLELASQDVELLVVNGGDGTLSHALTGILAHGDFDGRVPQLAVLRGGRTNMSARDLGSGRNPVRALAGLIEAARAGRLAQLSVDRPVLRVQHGPRGSGGVTYGMFFGAGVIYRGIELVHRFFPRERQGVFGASLVTAALLGRTALLGDTHGVLQPDKIHMLLDGAATDRGESLLVMATSLERLFLGMRPFWGLGDGAVRFTSIAAEAQHMARSLPRILAGQPGSAVGEATGFTSRNAKRVDLRLDCGLTVDGELLAPERERIVSITADHRVRFVRA
jgi:diacylglycerol kinase (ATP)